MKLSRYVALFASLLVSLGLHAQIKISTLPAAGTQTGAEVFPQVQSGVTVKATLSSVKTFVLPNVLDLCTQVGVDPIGNVDSRAAVASAFAAVAGTNQVLEVNCPIKIAIGTDITKPIFVRSNTTVRMGPSGVFIVDNNTIPAFAINNSTNVTWVDAQFEYVGTYAIDNSVAPYAGLAGQWNDGPCKSDLAAHSGITFSGSGSCLWTGPTNISAIMLVKGGSNITLTNPHFFVPSTANATQFIPVCITLDDQWLPNQPVTNNNNTVNASSANGAQNFVITGGVFDGFLMGIVGGGATGSITNTQFVRYSDLQDASYLTNGVGGNQGGVNTWFAPPHAIYLQDGDVSFHSHFFFGAITDLGVYVGGTTRRAGSSGSILSLKTNLTNGTVVDGYTSYRPDGFMDTLANFSGNSGGAMRNVYAEFDSSIIGVGGSHTWGWRFPSALPYLNEKFENITIIDNAAVPTGFPLSGLALSANRDLSFTGIRFFMNDVPTGGSAAPTFMAGTNITYQAEYHYANFSSTATFVYGLGNQGTAICANCSYDVTLFGWRQPAITFSAALAAGSTGATLQTAWQYQTGTYSVTFSDRETRYVSFTNGSTAIGSFAALTAGVTSVATGGNMLGVNLDAYKPRILIGYAAGSANTHSHVADVSNGYDVTTDAGVMVERWAQSYLGSPVGTTAAGQTTNIAYPNTFSIDSSSISNITAIASGPTGMNVGWTGNDSALFANVAIASGTNPVHPLTAPIALPNNPTTVVIKPIGGNFGTGTVLLSTRGTRILSGK